MNTNEHNKNQVLFSIDLALIISLFASFVYLCGWSYSYYYFSNFNLGLIHLGIPEKFMFIYGVHVLYEFRLLSLFLSIILVICYFSIPQVFRKLLLTFITILFFSGIGLGKYTANKDYSHQKKSDYSSYPRVKVLFNKITSQKSELSALKNTLAGECYRLLLENKEKVFVFISPKEKKEHKLPVIEIHQSNIDIIKVIPIYHSCH